MFRSIRVIAASAALLFTSACGGGVGGGSSTSSPVVSAPASGALSPDSFVPVEISLFLPVRNISSSATSKRARQGITSTVRSFTVTATEQGGARVSGSAVVVEISASNVACTSATGGLTCTASIESALGQDTWSVQVYASSDGSGTALASGSISATVIQGAVNVFMANLDPSPCGCNFVWAGE